MTSEIAEQETTGKASLWEDFVDIYFAPSAVFERRRDGRFGTALIVLTLLLTALSYAFFSTLSAAFEADIAREMARMSEDVQIPQAMVTMSRNLAIFGSLVMVPIGAFLTGLLLALIGRLFGADLTYVQGITIATFAMFPRVLATLSGIVQGILLAPNTMSAVSTSPARFLDPETTSTGMLTLLARFDIFVLWSVVLSVIGLRIIGRMKGSRAWMAAIVVWLIVTIPAVIGLLLNSARG
jgi:hypothetical protein